MKENPVSKPRLVLDDGDTSEKESHEESEGSNDEMKSFGEEIIQWEKNIYVTFKRESRALVIKTEIIEFLLSDK